MSMNTYPLQDIGLAVTPSGLLPYAVLALDRKAGQIPEEIQAIIQSGRFRNAVEDRDEALQTNSYFDISRASDALDALGIESSFCFSFDGTMAPIDPVSLEPMDEDAMEFSDDAIVYIPAKRPWTPFKPAYASFKELLAELEETVAPVGLPEDFSLAPHIVQIKGTYYC